ncbi:PhzF family isomerase [Enterococcus casseliflavus]|uniref:PhzF family isomerase n=1 Tax=Enterococcus casseliflavus TaxID=37734 RepID=UPI001883EE4F|nr:PhzF family isomerase [Enterococcus casseliflavus]MBE9879783.1 PhzF family isomerase [Enterococcus casseliflavus]
MTILKVYQVDAFTTEKFRGNPAGVVLNGDNLTDQEMQAIARELNNSETAFLLSPDSPDHDVRTRYFTPKTEVPICGHATIASQYVRAIENNLESCRVMNKINIGTLPIEINKLENDYTITMAQGDIEFSQYISGSNLEFLMNALRITENDLDERCPVQIVSTGRSKVLIGIKSRHVLDRIVPNLEALKELSKAIDCTGYFLFTLHPETETILSHGRMFAPISGIDEDPVTGNAVAPLGAYLIKHKLVKHDNSMFSFKVEQGHAMGRSGVVDVSVLIKEGEPVEVSLGGSAVIVFETEIVL